MESEVKEFVEVELKLNKREAQWLKGLVQNPCVCLKCNPEYLESAEDSEMRREFWESLKGVRPV